MSIEELEKYLLAKLSLFERERFLARMQAGKTLRRATAMGGEDADKA